MHPIEKARKMILYKLHDDTKHFYAEWETTAKKEDEICMLGVDIGLETALKYIDECLKGGAWANVHIEKENKFCCANCACASHEMRDVCMAVTDGTEDSIAPYVFSEDECERPDWCPAFIVEDGE